MAFTRPNFNQLNTSITKIEDPILEINSALTGANTSDLGIIINRGSTGDNVGILWDKSAQQFAFVQTTADSESSGDLAFTSYADLQVKNLATDAFAFPAADGTDGQVLTTDGGGVVAFETISVTEGQISDLQSYLLPSDKGIANGIATLDAGLKIPSAQLPALALTDVFTVVSEVAQLALTAQEGDIAIRTDLNKTYAHNGGVAGTMADWSDLLTPTDVVLSVGGNTGAVTAAQLLTSIKTVDGTTSGLDSDLLDGQEGSYYYSAGNPPPASSTGFSGWNSYSISTNYLAATDLVVYGLRKEAGSNASTELRGYTDAASVPTTMRTLVNGREGQYASLVMNVKQGDYWRVDPANAAGTISGLWWIG